MTTMKTLTYGVMHFAVAVSVAYAVSGEWALALAIGTLEPLVQTLAYNLHERAWLRNAPRAEAWLLAHTH